MSLNIPVPPSISDVTFNSALVTNEPDGNPSGTYYAYKVVYNSGDGAVVKYLNTDGTLFDTPVWMNISSITATTLIPNTLFSISLGAATNVFGAGSTGFGDPTTLTTAASSPLFRPFSSIYSTTVTANWQPNGNNDETAYYVQLSTDPSFNFNVLNSGWVVSNSYAFNNLILNTIYWGRVKARNSVLEETSYTTLGSVTTANGPSIVTGIRSTNLLANQGFLIQWSANPAPNIFIYRVYRSSSPTDDSSFQVIGTTPANVTSYVDNVPFTFGITWYYKVTALDTGNNESALELTSPVQDMSFHSFEEQPFPTQINTPSLVNGETPSGLLDGTNTLFTTTYPFRNGTLSVYLNGVKLMQGIDYILNIPQQFTLVIAPVSMDYLRVDYIKF